MKKYLLYITAAAFLMAACDKEPLLEDPPEETVGVITMTTKASGVSFQIELTSGTDSLVIDWGDGEGSKTYASSCEYSDFCYLSVSHSYSSASEHNITITGDIVTLFCNNNQLTALDVSKNITLTKLTCSGNQLTALDMSHNTMLTYLHCSNNHLTTLDLSKNIALVNFSCQYNQLKTLDMSSNISLQRVYCQYNQLTTIALNDLFRTLHDNVFSFYSKAGWMDLPFKVRTQGNPGADDCDVSIAEEKGWRVNPIEIQIPIPPEFFGGHHRPIPLPQPEIHGSLNIEF